jgi:hypothetical protein
VSLDKANRNAAEKAKENKKNKTYHTSKKPEQLPWQADGKNGSRRWWMFSDATIVAPQSGPNMKCIYGISHCGISPYVEE